MEQEKKLSYNFYDKALVEKAEDYSKNAYPEYMFDSDCKFFEMLNKKALVEQATGENVHEDYKLLLKEAQERIELAFLQGIEFAVRNNIGSYKPNDKEQISRYHSEKDFAILFNFSDNDFGGNFEKAAQFYCDRYNSLLANIDLYEKHSVLMSKSYIRDIELLEKEEIIKEILKMGVASYSFERDATDFREINNFNKSQEEVNHLINEYLPFNKEITKWEKDENGKYFANGTIPRLVVGTRSDIEMALVNHGHEDGQTESPRDFPVWCNGEVLIIYMKDGYLTHLTR